MEPKLLGTLVVVVGTAKNLPNKSRFGKQDPFCTVQIGSVKRRTQPIKRGGQHPEWDEELRFPIHEDVDDMMAATTSKPLPGEPGVVTPQSMASKARKPGPKKGGKVMKVAVWADDIKEPELIGEVTVTFDEVLVKGEVDDWWTLQSKDGKDKYCGEVYMELTFFSNAPPPRKNRPPQQGQSPIRPPGRPGLPTSSSVSGMNLYIPPYQAQQAQAAQAQAQRPPQPQGYANHTPHQTPPQTQQHAPQRPVSNTYASNSFAELGLPPQPPQLHGSISGHSQSIAANSLSSQMGSMSLGPSHQQRPGANAHQAATIGHGRPQSYVASPPPPPPPPQQPSQNGAGAAPWAALLPHNQGQQQQAPPLPRPVSANDMGYPHDPRASSVPPRPNSSIQQQQVPLPTPGHGRTGSLTHNLAPPSVGSPPVAYGNNFQPLPQPPRSTSPAQFGASYQTPPTSQPGSFSHPTPPQPPQIGGYQQPQQQPYPPAQPPAQQGAYTTPQPPRQGTWPPQGNQQTYQQQGAPQQFPGPHAASSGPNTPQAPGAYPSGAYGSPAQHHQPMQAPHRNSVPGTSPAPSTTTGPYVPWHMQTPATFGGPGGAPARPAPPARPSAGYYPSDELYVAPQQHQQPPIPQHQQSLPPQQPLPPAHQPPPPSLPQAPQPPPPPQNYGYTSPPPQQHQAPMSSFPPQQPQSNFRPNAPPRVPSPAGYAPVPPPRGHSPLPPNAQPSNSPPQTNSDWRSYLQGLGSVGSQPPPSAPQTGDWYPPASGSSNTMQHAQAQTGYAPQQW